RAVGLLPLPDLAQLRRQLPSAESGVDVNELLDESNVVGRDDPTSILPLRRHAGVWHSQNRNARANFKMRSPAATLVLRPSRDCLRPRATAPDALPVLALPACPSATTETGPWTNVSVPARIPGRHRPECGLTFRADCGTETDNRKMDRPEAFP